MKTQAVFAVLSLVSLGGVTLHGADAANDTYTNPVGGDIRMGDPFVFRHDGRYYLYGTTAPDGFRCWTSTNLVNWESLGYAYRRTPQSWGIRTVNIDRLAFDDEGRLKLLGPTRTPQPLPSGAR